jgi:hypothetical protein
LDSPQVQCSKEKTSDIISSRGIIENIQKSDESGQVYATILQMVEEEREDSLSANLVITPEY